MRNILGGTLSKNWYILGNKFTFRTYLYIYEQTLNPMQRPSKPPTWEKKSTQVILKPLFNTLVNLFLPKNTGHLFKIPLFPRKSGKGWWIEIKVSDCNVVIISIILIILIVVDECETAFGSVLIATNVALLDSGLDVIRLGVALLKFRAIRTYISNNFISFIFKQN